MDFSNEVYGVLIPYLHWPEFNWAQCLLLLGIAHWAPKRVLLVLQERELSKPLPQILRNVIRDEDYTKQQSHALKKLRYEGNRDFYWLSIRIIYFSVLTRLWNGARFIAEEVLPEEVFLWIDPNLLSEETLQCILFFALFTVLYAILSIPTSYYETCILSDEPESEKTARKWITGLLGRAACVLLTVSGIIYVLNPLAEEQGVEFVYQMAFHGICTIYLVFLVFLLFLQPFVSYLGLFNLKPLQPGKTKSAIEELAVRLHFPINEIYTQDKKRRRGKADFMIFGPPWKRNVAMYNSTLEQGNTDDVVGLIAHEIGSWKHSTLQHVLGITLIMILYLIPVMVIFINWRDVCHSFGLKDSWGFEDEHPIALIALLVGGALHPFTSALLVCIRSVSRWLDSKADDFAVENGYGKQLARALIKTNIKDVLKKDWLYDMFCNEGRHSLCDRLRALGWTGEEEISEAKEIRKYDHWGAA